MIKTFERNKVALLGSALLVALLLQTHSASAQVMDTERYGSILADQLEFRKNQGTDTFKWDVQGWYGGDYNKLWVKTEGETTLSSNRSGNAEVQVLYSKLIAPFFDLQIGARYDRTFGPGPDMSRSFAVLGIQGLAPYWFELEPALFLSENGDVSGRFVGSYDWLFTQRLIAQGRLESNFALQEVPKFGVGSGINDVGAGLRLRYEVTREFAPYVGVSWSRKFGGSANFARAGGERIENTSLNLGIRWRF